MNERYIIVEVIPEAVKREDGQIVQLSALKINGLELESRFDYRLNEDKVKLPDMLKIVSYDKDNFKYVDNDNIILDEFKKWSEGLKLLILDNKYTRNFLNDLENEKESVTNYLGLKYNDDVLDEIVKKYNLEYTSYVVDLLYEALLFEKK